MRLELFDNLMELVFSDMLYTVMFFLAFVGFFVAIYVNSVKRGKPYRRNTLMMVWGSLSTLTVLAVAVIILLDLLNILMG